MNRGDRRTGDVGDVVFMKRCRGMSRRKARCNQTLRTTLPAGGRLLLSLAAVSPAIRDPDREGPRVDGGRRSGRCGGVLCPVRPGPLGAGTVGDALATIDGIAFSILRYRYKTLWAAIFAHGFYNTIGFVSFYVIGPVHGFW
jgi:Type II CAAX prenyl endopeptidase Rce1-like